MRDGPRTGSIREGLRKPDARVGLTRDHSRTGTVGEGLRKPEARVRSTCDGPRTGSVREGFPEARRQGHSRVGARSSKGKELFPVRSISHGSG